MAVGLHAVNLANKWLDMLRGTAFTAPTAVWIQLHTADPASAGTTAVSTGIATRNQITWSAAASGAIALSSLSSYTATGADTITHISAWSASTSGTFYFSGALTTSKTVANGDTLSFTTLGVSLTPLAA